MAFLAPLFLAGLAALAIPLFVHLTHRERREPVIFPSLMFLEKIPFRTHRRQRIRHWLLFLMRALAVALLVLAFARPFFARRQAEAAGGGNVVLLVDRSASMASRGRWDRAMAAAREAAAPGPAKIAVVAFDDRAEGLTPLNAERAPVEAALASLRPGSAAGRLSAGLQTAAAMLETTGGEIVLISDFQRAGWDGAAASRLPAGVTLRTVDVGDTTGVSAGITGVLLERQAGAEARTAITARLAAARGAARDIPVTLSVEDRDVQTVTVRVAPGQSALAHFAALRDPQGERRARITIPPDDQPADDRWHFLLGPAPRIGVIVATRGDAAPRDLLYLREALAVAHDPTLTVSARAGGALRAGDLAVAGVVLMHDVPFPGGDAGRRLQDWVQAGGGLVIALGARGSLPPWIADSIGTGASVADRGELGATVSVTDDAHPVLQGWGDRADLAAVRAFRYRRLDKARIAPLRHDDGTAALAEVRIGTGRVLVWASDFSNRWSDVPLHGAFVPLVHGLVRHAARFEAPRGDRIVGDIAELPAPRAGETIVEAPDGSRALLPEGAAGVALRQSGIYAVRAGENAAPALIAANVPASESDPSRVVPEQVLAAVTPLAGSASPASAGIESSSDRERGQRLWWYALAGVVLLLAAESAVAHRARRTA